MPSKVYSAAIVGLHSQEVEVEVDIITTGKHAMTIVGLPDTSIKESRDRVGSAIKNSGFQPIHRFGKMTVNMAPADLPKTSSIYDVPLALSLLQATDQLSFDSKGRVFLGELALNGTVRPISGVLPIALWAKREGYSEIFVPQLNAHEAQVVEGLQVFPVKNLYSLSQHLAGHNHIEPLPYVDPLKTFETPIISTDLSHIKGQQHAKRALEIAAAGAHNILFNGPPGSGKTLLARALPSILPSMTMEECLDVTKIFSIAGLLKKGQPIITERPIRSPHHSASAVSLIGGGTQPKPGEISLAHRGVLFLDEFPEFGKSVLEHLRQPLEDGTVTVSRARGTSQFPSRFMLICAMNPCPCGFLTDSERMCSCTQAQISKYSQKISGPIMDRIDLQVEVPRPKISELETMQSGEASSVVQSRVEHARKRQSERFSHLPILSNAEMSSQLLKELCPLDEQSKAVLGKAVSSLKLSARAYYRTIKIARTIADLSGSSTIEASHIAESIQYRFKTD